MNYADLTTQLQEITDNDESTFVSNIPNFVRRAEERIYRDLKLPKQRKVNTSLATANGVRTLTLPTDFLSPDYFSVISSNTHYYMLAKEPDFLREAYPSTTTTGRPVYYAILDDTTIVLAPTPDAVYATELAYESKPASIVDTSTTWIGTNCENALLYASLVEALIFLVADEQMIETYDRRYNEAVGKDYRLSKRVRTDEYRNPSPVAGG